MLKDLMIILEGIAIEREHDEEEKETWLDKLKAIQRNVSAMNPDERSDIDPLVLHTCVQLMTAGISRCKEKEMMKDHLEIVRLCFVILRNSFINCSTNQNAICRSEDDLLEPLLDCVLWVYNHGYRDQTSQNCESPYNNQSKKNVPTTADCDYCLDALQTSCATCLTNLVAANSNTRHAVWPKLQGDILDVLSCNNLKVCRIWCCFIHHCLLEEDLKQNILKETDVVNKLIKRLIEIDEETASANEFVQLCLNALLPSDGVVENLWLSTTRQEQTHIIAYIISIIEVHDQGKKSWCSLPRLETLQFLINVFKKDADKLLKAFSSESSSLEPEVMNSLLSLASTAAASDAYQSPLQNDRSLVISSVYLLRAICEIGETSTNCFTRVTTIESTSETGDIDIHPAFGFKANLIRLIGLLCYKNTSNQDLIREINGVLLILENTQFDARNPLIKENALFTLHALLEGNTENKNIIKSLEVKGVKENKTLDKLGMEAIIENNQVKIKQKGPC